MTPADTSLQISEHDRANGELGFRFVRALAVEKAALDQRLTPASVRVLAALSYFMNNTARRSWPGYALIADVTGYSHHTIETAIRELKAAAYIFTERKSPTTGGRALVHYGLCAMDVGAITAMVEEAVAALRKADPAKNLGVRLTHQKTRGSTPDPAVFAASDPTVFAPQKPLLMNPKNEGQIEAFAALLFNWGSPRLHSLTEADLAKADAALASELDALPDGVGASIVTRALAVALNKARFAIPKTEGPQAFLGYFRKVLRDAVDEVAISDRDTHAKAATAAAKAKDRHERAITPAHGRASKSSTHDLMDAVLAKRARAEG